MVVVVQSPDVHLQMLTKYCVLHHRVTATEPDARNALEQALPPMALK